MAFRWGGGLTPLPTRADLGLEPKETIMTEKQTYEAPQLDRVGSLEEMTLGNATGSFTDKAYPTGTALSSETFS